MRSQPLLWLVSIAAVIACTSPTDRSVIQLHANGLRTFSVVETINGVPATCGAAFAARPHVEGRLAGDPKARPDPVWLVDPGGTHLSMIWPEGFTLQFAPLATLLDENGNIKAQAGDWIELNQSAKDHAGSYQDPYIAQWFIEDAACYVYRP